MNRSSYLTALEVAVLSMNNVWRVRHLGELQTVWQLTIFLLQDQFTWGSVTHTHTHSHPHSLISQVTRPLVVYLHYWWVLRLSLPTPFEAHPHHPRPRPSWSSDPTCTVSRKQTQGEGCYLYPHIYWHSYLNIVLCISWERLWLRWKCTMVKIILFDCILF